MKTHKLIATLLVVSSAYGIDAYAHDPKEHAKEKQAPNCEAMQDMGKMNKNDPVAMAMMKKCHQKADDNQAGKHMDGMKAKDGHH
ncbi:MAG: hypothetical protein ACI9C4_002847 [Paraglaciecola sp.]|jgi:hypothetical protein